MGRRSALSRIDGTQLGGCVRPAAADGALGPLLDDRLAQIVRWNVSTLRARWASRFGRPPPKGVGRRLLELAAAYQEQAKILGDLEPAARRMLLQMARTGTNAKTGSLRRNRKAPLSPGSR